MGISGKSQSGHVQSLGHSQNSQQKNTAASGWDGAVNPGLLQLWAPELFDDVPPPEMPLVSAQWLWAALSNDPKTALAEMVAAKSDTWLT